MSDFNPFKTLFARFLLVGIFAQFLVVSPVSADAPSVIITRSGPASTSYATGAKDVALLNFTIITDSEITFNSFPIGLDMSSDASDSSAGLLSEGSTANITDIKITDADTGDTIFTAVDANALTTALGGSTLIDETSDDATSYYLFTDELTMGAGTYRNFVLSVDIASEVALNGGTIVASMPLGTTYPVMEDADGNTIVNSDSLIPTLTMTGNTMTISAPSLSMALTSTPTPGSNIYMKGADNVPFVGMAFTCGSASDCVISDLIVQGYYDDEGDADDFDTAYDSMSGHGTSLTSVVSSIWLKDSAGSLVGTSEAINPSTYRATFSSLTYTIDAGDTEVLYVMGDISTSAFANSDAENIAFGISSGPCVTAEDSSGSVISVTGSVNTAPITYVTTDLSGSLTVSVDADTPREDIVVAGTSDVELAVYNFVATSEDFIVDSLSVNNIQSGVAFDDLGDADNNISVIRVFYENSFGVSEEKSAYLVYGTAQFSGMDFYVPQDGSATLTITADLNPIVSAGSSATSGELIGVNLAFNNFLAIGQASGEELSLADLDASVSTDADLDFGAISYTNGDNVVEVQGRTALLVSAGSEVILRVDNGVSDNTNKLPVGTIVCVDDNRNGICRNEDIFIVTAWPASPARTFDRVTLMTMDDAGDSRYDDNDPLLYALPGQGFLSTTNLMRVYETIASLTLSSSSPSGSRTVSEYDSAFIFNLEADIEEKVSFGTSVDFATCLAGTGTTLVSASTTTVSVDGSACEVTDVNTAGDSLAYGSSVNLANYAHVSFWFRWNDDSANANTLLPSELNIFTADANDGVEDNIRSLNSSNVVGSPAYFNEGTWYQVRDVQMPVGTDLADTYIGLAFQDTDTLDSLDRIYIDQTRIYNQKIEIDISSDNDFDRLQNPVIAYLKDGGATVATGYVDVVAIDSDEDGVQDSTDGANATLMFVPSVTYGYLEVSESSTKSFTVSLSTVSLLSEDTGEDDPVTFYIDYGSSTNGVVTPGDLFWSDSNNTVKWLGNVASSRLTSNTLKY
ncbi:MAG: hypothetical protein WC897_00190 [Candidatus Gracilibacteria bacterium]